MTQNNPCKCRKEDEFKEWQDFFEFKEILNTSKYLKKSVQKTTRFQDLVFQKLGMNAIFVKKHGSL